VRVAIIFVIDDYAVHRETLRAFLTQRGHTVVVAADGFQAMALLETWRPDLIVLDLWMPKADGFVVLAALRSIPPPRIPVIVTTAATDRPTQARAVDLGAALVMVKPEYSMAALDDAIAGVLATPAKPDDEAAWRAA
jgi:CheY-like chemotaxis protein